jgi:hypothetical protein
LITGYIAESEMKRGLLTMQAFLLWGISTLSYAQTEHYAGLAISNVTGVSYRFCHNRWMAVADGGWLTGFKGIYASAGGMYEVLDMGKLTKFFYKKFDYEKEDIVTVNLGLGFYAQGYCSASVRQQKWAEMLGYAAPFGALMWSEVRCRYRVTPNWCWALRFRAPLNEDVDAFSKDVNALIWATAQLVVQYKF